MTSSHYGDHSMQPRFHSAWITLPANLQSALADTIGQDDFTGYLTHKQVIEIKQNCNLDDQQLALALLPLAAACAITPISHFNVGAVAAGESGNLYFGANMEFVSAPLQQSVHAEQSAINHAWLRGEKKLNRITVNYSPCGHCRQFMNELNSGTALQIQLPNRPISTLNDYLPDAFGPKDLQIETLLLDEVSHDYYFLATNAVVAKALEAANHSHAPYSLAHSGVALQDTKGRIYAGRYAENAAFNPSLPPLQSALILMNMMGGNIHEIQRAVLVEGANSILSQWEATQTTLMSLDCQDISLFQY